MLIFIDVQVLNQTFFWGLEPKLLHLEGSDFGIRVPIYALNGSLQKVPITVTLGVKASLPEEIIELKMF